jgi:predicted HTH transcriptional regulator
MEYLQSIVRELTKLPSETEWIEFKCNNQNPQRIAEYISGISNAATLCDKPKGYLIWGINNETHEITGTDFEYYKAKKGNEELEAWLAKMINPYINFRFYEIPFDNLKVVLLEIPCAETEPTKFGATAYIRIGANLKPLVGYKDKEKKLWQQFETTPYELRIAATNLSEDDVVMLLDYPKYYDKLDLPIPKNRERVLGDLAKEKFIKRNDAANWDVTNLGALMIAKDFKNFDNLARKTVRVIWYKNDNRLEAFREKEFVGGYSVSHDDVVEYIMTIIPQEEVIVGAVRKTILRFPEIAIHELLANMVIHQALEQRGTNPMVEVFSDRIEFSNAGAPLVSIERIIDTVPVSRNENIAGFMHKCGICEERGSGFDKIIDATSKNAMLAPRIENQNNQFTKVVLFARVPFDITTKQDRIRTCYMQACFAYINFGSIGNADIRKIFTIGDDESYKSSRVIKDTVEVGLIKPIDENTAPRYMKYIPYWA